MIPELQTLYYYEIDHAHLDFDSDPDYQENMARVLDELGTRELSPALFSLLNTANQISFTHGFRLGTSLVRWALRRYTHRARSPGKARRRRETAPAAILGKPGPSGPERTADRHSDLARRKCSDHVQACVPRSGVRGKRSYGPRRSRAEP